VESQRPVIRRNCMVRREIRRHPACAPLAAGFGACTVWHVPGRAGHIRAHSRSTRRTPDPRPNRLNDEYAESCSRHAASRLVLPAGTAVRRVGQAARAWHARRLAQPGAREARGPLRVPRWAYPIAVAVAVAIGYTAWWGMQPDEPARPRIAENAESQPSAVAGTSGELTPEQQIRNRPCSTTTARPPWIGPRTTCSPCRRVRRARRSSRTAPYC
jgi:hypothetical protein